MSFFKCRLTKISIALVGVLLVGLFLRLHNIDKWSLSVDEAFSERVASSSSVDIIRDSASDVHPPLYFFSLHVWEKLFGNSEFSIRGLSVLFGCVSIYLIYILGLFIFNEDVGVLSALFLAISSFNIQYSQDARMYSLLLLLSLLSIYLFLVVLEKPNGKALYLWLLFTNIFLLYTHLYGLLVVAFEILWLVFVYFEFKKLKLNDKIYGAKKILFSISVSCLLFLPWVFVIIKQKAERVNPWLAIPSLLEILTQFSGSVYLLLLFIPFLLIPFFWKKKEGKEKVIFLYVLWIFIVFVPLIISIFIFPAIRPRFLIFASAIFYIPVAYAITLIRDKTIRIHAILWIIVLSFFAINSFYDSSEHANWKNTAIFVDKQARLNDLVIFNAGFALDNGFNYYSRRNDIVKIPFPKISERINVTIDENNIKELDSFLSENHRNVWVIYYSTTDTNDLIRKKIEDRGYSFSDEKEFSGIWVDQFVE